MSSRTSAADTARWFVPLTLGGVELRPMCTDDVHALYEAGRDPELWRWTTACVSSLDDMSRYVEEALAEVSAGASMPYVTAVDGEIVGSTRFGNIDLRHQRAEIGWTWLSSKWQRTIVNTTAKYLMMLHAFERMELGRVELKTDALNERSRTAIARIGATEEGILRHHMRTWSGRWRDTAYYSVLATEWPSVKRHLEERLAWHRTSSSGE